MNSIPPNPQVNDLTDRTIGDYHIIRRLGRGGMADVYLAEQLSLKRNVAFKVLKPELAVDKSYVERFHREAQAAAALVQANIVQIYEVGEAEGIHFIAQEYISGRNLRQYLGRHGAVEPLMALAVLRQVTLALQRADEMGVVHRDIKPENIMLSTTGDVKVTDFGLARLTDDQDVQLGLTKIGITMGTPLYMSPEQAEGKHLDSRSDIYSLGATAYHMLAGQPPFDGENAIAIAVKQVNESAQPLSEIRPDCPEELTALVHRMMSKDPDDRPDNATALLKDLRKVRISDDDNWELLVERIASHDTQESAATVPDSKLAVTRQLQSVMRGHLKSWWKSSTVLATLMILAFAGLAVGALTAIVNPPKSIFDGVEHQAISDSVPKQATVVEQYRMAYWASADFESHWKAVAEYFPPDEAKPEARNKTIYYNQLAKERLAELYMGQKDYAAAMEIYQQFADTEDVSLRVTVIGWAGQAVIYDLNQEVNNAQAALKKVEPNLEMLSDFLKGRIEELIRKYSQPSISF